MESLLRRKSHAKLDKTSRKGQGSLMETLLIIFLSVAIVAVAFQIPRIIDSFVDLMTLASAEATARDLAGMITVSGAATDDAVIKYKGTDADISYDVKIEERFVYVTGVRKDGELIMESGQPTGTTGVAKTAVGDIHRTLVERNVFNIKKNRTVDVVETGDDYDVN